MPYKLIALTTISIARFTSEARCGEVQKWVADFYAKEQGQAPGSVVEHLNEISVHLSKYTSMIPWVLIQSAVNDGAFGIYSYSHVCVLILMYI